VLVHAHPFTRSPVVLRSGAELPYVWGGVDNYANVSLTPTEMTLSARVMTFWTNFAATGNPNGRRSAAQIWPAYSARNIATIMNIDTTPDSGPIPLPANWTGASALWGNCLRWIEYYGFPSPLAAEEPTDTVAAETLSTLSGVWKGTLAFDGEFDNCTVAETLTFDGAAITVAVSSPFENEPLQSNSVVYSVVNDTLILGQSYRTTPVTCPPMTCDRLTDRVRVRVCVCVQRARSLKCVCVLW
jgi:hypothetical protein